MSPPLRSASLMHLCSSIVCFRTINNLFQLLKMSPMDRNLSFLTSSSSSSSHNFLFLQFQREACTSSEDVNYIVHANRASGKDLIQLGLHLFTSNWLEISGNLQAKSWFLFMNLGRSCGTMIV
jgi:hypothetical protein